MKRNYYEWALFLSSIMWLIPFPKSIWDRKEEIFIGILFLMAFLVVKGINENKN